MAAELTEDRGRWRARFTENKSSAGGRKQLMEKGEGGERSSGRHLKGALLFVSELLDTLISSPLYMRLAICH